MSASFCLDCKDKTCLKSKKPCEEVEDLLRSEGIYSRDWIRPEVSKQDRQYGKSKYREIPFSSLPKGIQRKLGIESPEK